LRVFRRFFCGSSSPFSFIARKAGGCGGNGSTVARRIQHRFVPNASRLTRFSRQGKGKKRGREDQTGEASAAPAGKESKKGDEVVEKVREGTKCRP